MELVRLFPSTDRHGPLGHDWLIFKSAVGRSEGGSQKQPQLSTRSPCVVKSSFSP